jgi:hypothetical protein
MPVFVDDHVVAEFESFGIVLTVGVYDGAVTTAQKQ